MKTRFSEFALGIVLLAIGAFFGYWTQKLQVADDKRIRFLDYRVEIKPDILRELEVPGRAIEVRVDDKKVDAVSEVTVEIFNRTDKDFEQIRFYVSLSPRYQQAVTVLGDYPTVYPEIPEAITRVQDLKPSTNSQETPPRFAYDVKTLNRSLEPYSPSFSIRFVTIGLMPPEVKVATDKPGVMFRLNASRQPFIELPWWARYGHATVPVGGVIIILLLMRLAGRSIQKAGYRIGRELHKQYLGALIAAGKNSQDAAALADRFVQFEREQRWKSDGRFFNWLSGVKYPSPSDLVGSSAKASAPNQGAAPDS